MSIEDNKVQFGPEAKASRSRAVILALTGIEVVLTLVLAGVIAITRLLNPSTEAAAGVPSHLSYQGRLTDTSGNALGGSGTNYCMRFAIYDASTSGAKLWPAGTPATNTISVVSGVFNADVGSADALTYNFYDTSTVYLNVDVVNATTSNCTTATGTWESLTPRQQIMATGFAITAQNVYGNLLRTQIASSTVQVGTGAGVASTSAIYLGLDWVNVAQRVGSTCSRNGQVWYNSNASNTQTLVCDNGIINPVASGLLRWYENIPGGPSSTLIAAVTGSSQYIEPFVLPQGITASYIRIPVSWVHTSTSFATSTTQTAYSASALYTFWAVVYTAGTGANSASLQSLVSSSTGMSNQFSFSQSNNSTFQTVSYRVTYPGQGGGSSTYSTSTNMSTGSVTISSILTLFTGMRYLDIPFNTSLSAGNYWIAFAFSSTTSTQGSAALSGLRLSFAGSLAGIQTNLVINGLGDAANASNVMQIGVGSWSTNAINTTSSIGLAAISSSASYPRPYFQIIRQE